MCFILSFGLVHACCFAPFPFRLSSLRAFPIAAKLAATAAFFATRLTFAPTFGTRVLLDFAGLLAFVVLCLFDLTPARFDGDLDLARDLNFARFEEDFDLVRLAAFFMIPPGPLYCQ
jgi:hypothetical protein